jgi:predicted house-cleaning noncanonical NTP pyrophosphatase (MazG superfamily)
MNIVFELAKTKALICNRKPGNTNTPWTDFSTNHLSKRLDEEFEEGKESDNVQELLDIINLAAFLWLSRFEDIDI